MFCGWDDTGGMVLEGSQKQGKGGSGKGWRATTNLYSIE